MAIEKFLKRITRFFTIFFFKIIHGQRLGSLGRNSVIKTPMLWTPSYIFVGNNVHVQPGCRIEGISRWGSLEFSPRIILEDSVTIEQNCHFIAVKDLFIRKGSTVSFGVMITDNEHEYRKIGDKVLSQPILYSLTDIGENCFIGAGAKIQAGTILGKQCVVGANSVVRGKFPDYSVIVGVPGRIVKRYCETDKQWKKTNVEGEFLNE
jgi:acetyltransferase-like isoleucine patch superfamily enzyme